MTRLEIFHRHRDKAKAMKRTPTKKTGLFNRLLPQKMRINDNTARPLSLDRITTELLHQLVLDLLCEKPRTLLSLVQALQTNVPLRQAYVQPLLWHRIKDVQRRYAWMNAWNRLATLETASETKITTWEQAKEAMASVFDFATNVDDDQQQGLSQRMQQLRLFELQQLEFSTKESERLLLEIIHRDVKPRLDRADEQLQERLESANEAPVVEPPALRPLTSTEQELVDEALHGPGDETEILARKESETVQRGSLRCLRPGKWLNDEVIHYFLMTLADRDEELNPDRRSHFFKSFFVTKLLNEGSAKEGTYEYKNVKRWSKKAPGKDLFSLDKIVFPINQNQMHWVCAVAFMRERKIQFYDSMGSNGMYYLKHLLQYLKDEHQDKNKSPLPGDWELIPSTDDTPQQLNGYDCGVFTCMFADFVSRDAPLNFDQSHVTKCRERIALSILQGRAIV